MKLLVEPIEVRRLEVWVAHRDGERLQLAVEVEALRLLAAQFVDAPLETAVMIREPIADRLTG